MGELSVNRRTCQLLIAVRTAGSDQLDQRVPAPRDQGLERSDHPAMEDVSGGAPTSILEELAPEQIIDVLSHFQLFKADGQASTKSVSGFDRAFPVLPARSHPPVARREGRAHACCGPYRVKSRRLDSGEESRV